MAHIHGRLDNQGEWFDDILGRGAGDPDMAETYPGEQPYLPKVPSPVTFIILGKTNLESTTPNTKGK